MIKIMLLLMDIVWDSNAEPTHTVHRFSEQTSILLLSVSNR